MTTTVTLTEWVQDSPLGPLAVRAGSRGVQAIRRAPGGSGAGSPDGVVARALDAYFAGDLSALDVLSVDLSACTPFVAGVLTALRSVPAGQVVSYGRLAAACGRPGAARAVGRAVGANPVLVVIPCHRVIAGDGSLGGFSAGLDAKRWLLSHEGRGALVPLSAGTVREG